MQREFATEWSPPNPSRLRPLLARVLADPHVYFLALAPLYILLASSNWIFSAPQTIDPWVYHGFFRNLVEYKTALFPGTYYGSRLSWILPGHAAYTLLPPLVANYVLHLGLWYTAVFALYYTLKTTAGRQVALIGSVFLGSFSYFLRPVGSDYVDGPANVYFLLCFAFLTAAAVKERKRLPMVLGGALYAAVVYTNLFTIVFTPVVAVYFALLAYRCRGRITGRSALESLVWFVSGSAALTAFLAIVNFAIEGSFAFYMPSVYYVLGNAGQPNPWKLPVEQWISQAEWLVLPGVVAVSALLALASARFRASTAGPAASAAFLLAFLVMIFCEWRGIPVLQYSYYASYLIPPAFLVVGALLQGPLERLSGAAALALGFAVLLIVTAPFWGFNAHLNQLKADTWPFTPLLFGAVFAVCGLCSGKAAGWSITAALAGCLVTSSSIGYAFGERHQQQNSFARIAQAAVTVDEVRDDDFIWFWYSKKDPHFGEFNALHSIYLWGYTMIGDEFPSLKPDAVIADGALVVIPSSSGEVLSCATQTLDSRLFTAEPIERREITGGGTSYSLWFVRLKFDSGRLERLALQPCGSGNCSTLAAAGESAHAQLPLEGWHPSSLPQTTVERESEGVAITTALTREGYAAKYGPLVAETRGRYVFKLQYVLAKGGIAFGAKPADESRWLSRASIPVTQPGERTAVLSLEAEAGEPFWLMISNDHPVGDHASQYLILELEAYRFPLEEAAAQARSTN
ncbi:MAG: hypothetical protein WD733_19035 [Bryobacterales bacterium]